MHPFITLGRVQLPLYSLMELLSIVTLILGVRYRQRRTDLPFHPGYVTTILFIALGGLLGAWLGANLPWLLNRVAGRYAPPLSWFEGRHWMGLVTGGALFGALYCHRHHLPLGKSFDVYAPVLPIMLAVIRLGCLSGGCCYGKETASWLARSLPLSRGIWLDRYPTRIASIIVNLLIAAMLLAFERFSKNRFGKSSGWPFPGFLFLMYIELYAVQRFFLEFWRADMPILFGRFTWTHLYAALWIAAATWGLWRGFRRRRMPISMAIGAET